MNRGVDVETAVSDYHEFPPPSLLRKYLVCLWTQTITGSEVEFEQHVLPDACVDIITINDEAPMVVGPWTQPFVARLAPGTTIVGARCDPGLASGLLGVPASALLNQLAPLSSVCGGAARAGFERIAQARGLSARRSAMATAVLNGFAHAGRFDQRTSAAILWLSQRPHGRIEPLSDWIGFSNSQLRHRFNAAVGYGPKMFQSVLRFQRLLHLAGDKNAPRNLARLSADAGYADQAHMTRDVQRFSGRPPTVLLESARCALQLSARISFKWLLLCRFIRSKFHPVIQKSYCYGTRTMLTRSDGTGCSPEYGLNSFPGTAALDAGSPS
jgi:AraC-like DNA-binding protein